MIFQTCCDNIQELTRRPLSTGIFSATPLFLLAKKYGEGEFRTHDLLEQEKFQAPARVRTQDLQPD